MLRVCVLRPDVVDAPNYASEGAAGLDLQAAIPEPRCLARGEVLRIPTGVAVELPARHEGQVRPRSGLAARHGVTLLNAPGTIDADYRGEICVLLINLGQEDYVVNPGDRIAQLVVAPVIHARIEVVSVLSALSSTKRGEDGFGSTGR
ncbi:MAG: dUTP diphosphatase [Myxococcales bacterium]|nr:dUTP diphosphatase [Myxococcales bacterium]